MEVKKDILWRVYLCFLFVIILGICVLGKAIYIQKVEGDYWVGLSNSKQIKFKTIPANRGSIYSEDGNILSTSVPIFDVFVDFDAQGLRAKDGKRFKENIDSLSYALSNLFGDKTKEVYEKELKFAYKNKERYYPLRKKINFSQYKALRNFPLVRLGKNNSGFIIDDNDKRINPYVLLANRTIGISRPDRKQNVGLELTYDSLLRGVPGQMLMRYAAGSYLPVEGSELDPVNGKDIVTTLDTYMQDVAQQALMNMLVNNRSVHGTAIVMEVATGKIKAIANLGVQPDGSFAEDLNYGIGKATEPGSIFKLATLLSLLEDGYVTNESIVDCEGGVKYFSGLRIKDSHLGTGKISILQSFYTSSNVAFAKLAEQYYGGNPKQFTDHLHKFRLDQMTGVDIVAASAKPSIKTKEKNRSWSKTTLPFMAHGYEELVTPLHMLMLYNAIANNGKMMRPYLVNAIQDYGINVRTILPEVLEEKIVSDKTIAQAKLCLRAVVDSLHGTGHKVLYDSAYTISGKTGTAVSANGKLGYSKGNKLYQSAFAGYFPSDNPQYSMIVVVQNSHDSRLVYGADVAGRVFKDISDKIYGHFLNNTLSTAKQSVDTNYYNIAGTSNDLLTISKYLDIKNNTQGSAFWETMRLFKKVATTAAITNATQDSKTMPSVVGMGLKDALYLLENMGLSVSFQGRGHVMSQSVPPGLNYKKGEQVELLLN